MTNKKNFAGDLDGLMGQFEGIFSEFFQRNRPKRGKDLQASLVITLEEADAGTKRDLEYRRVRGTESVLETLAVKVPPGIADRQILRIKDRGDELAGHPPGHLYITVSITPRAGITRDGNDLKVSIDVPRKGGKVTVPCVHGDREIDVPRAMKTGDTIVIAGGGMQIFGAPVTESNYREPPPSSRGNLIVTVRVASWVASLFRS